MHSTKPGRSSIPRSVYAMAIGYDNTTNLIWLIGAHTLSKSLISFNLSIWNESNAFTDYGENILPYHVICHAQSYVQEKGFVYIVGQRFPHSLYAFDVSTGSLNFINTNPSTYLLLSPFGCLAAIEDWIIYTNWNHTYILTISSLSWKLTGNPTMLRIRTSHACIVEPDAGYLYVIGGVFSNSIGKLYVNDIENIDAYNYTFLNDTLSIYSSYPTAILYQSWIYVVGGLLVDNINIIDTTTDTISVWGMFSNALAFTTSIIVDGRVYLLVVETARVTQLITGSTLMCLVYVQYM